jgi:hypothetical protein
MCLVSALNVGLLAWSWRQLAGRKDGPTRALLVLASVYTFVCAFRAVLPRADVQRIVLFDTWWSSVLVGRSVATVAELAFAAQWALVVWAVGQALGSRPIRWLAGAVLPLIATAEVCSWYAVVTTNYLGNALEESLWTATFGLVGLAAALAARQLDGPARWLALACVPGCLAYVGFMATVDVPMYLTRFQADTEAGRAFLGLREGLADLNSRWVVTYDVAEWHSERAWMALYFSVAVWASIALAHLPLSRFSGRAR